MFKTSFKTERWIRNRFCCGNSSCFVHRTGKWHFSAASALKDVYRLAKSLHRSPYSFCNDSEISFYIV